MGQFIIKRNFLVASSLGVMLLIPFLAGCGAGTGADTGNHPSVKSSVSDVAAAPTAGKFVPKNGAKEVATGMVDSNNMIFGTAVTAVFSQQMDPATIVSASAGAQRTFTLRLDNSAMPEPSVPGTVRMSLDHRSATFIPTAELQPNTAYRATITTVAKSSTNNNLANETTWRFTTKTVALLTHAPIDLGKAGEFTILTETGITDVYKSAVTGTVGTSPITGAAMLLACNEVTEKIYVVDAAGPAPCSINDPTTLTAAIGDMETAYTDAAGRNHTDYTELGAGEIGGSTLTPGLYKWGTGVLISKDVIISGGPNDVWIFQIAGTLTQANATHVTLTGGPQEKNIFWQVAGGAALGTTADFKGILLSKTAIAMKTNATATGRLYAQTAVTLEMNAITQPNTTD